MKKLMFLIVLLGFCGTAYAFPWDWSNDANGNRTKTENLWKDTDRDGTPNYYDRNDRNPYIR